MGAEHCADEEALSLHVLPSHGLISGVQALFGSSRSRAAPPSSQVKQG